MAIVGRAQQLFRGDFETDQGDGGHRDEIQLEGNGQRCNSTR